MLPITSLSMRWLVARVRRSNPPAAQPERLLTYKNEMMLYLKLPRKILPENMEQLVDLNAHRWRVTAGKSRQSDRVSTCSRSCGK